MISRHLPHDDLIWALDHSVRRYRVREARSGDSPIVRDPSLYLAIVPLNGSPTTVVAPRCGLFPGDWEDSDRYAAARLNAISMAGAARARTKRPDPDAVRLGHDFGWWCVELLRGERLAQRISFDTRAAACAEVERLVSVGLRRLPDAQSVLLYGGEG